MEEEKVKSLEDHVAELRKEPPWKNALDVILQHVEQQGREVLIPHEEIDQLLDLPNPEKLVEFEPGFKYEKDKTVLFKKWEEVYRNRDFEKMRALDFLREALLTDHKLYLYNIHAKGYMILDSDNQVFKVPGKHLKKARKHIIKAAKSLHYLDMNRLSIEARETQLRQMNRVAFLKTQFDKKKVPELKLTQKKLQ